MASARPAVLPRLARVHRELLDRARRADAESVATVLALGSAVLLHGAVEEGLLQEQWHLLDPLVVEELAADHARLEESLAFLEELQRTDPGSRDLSPLASAVLDHLRAHLERDERTLYEPLAHLGNAPRG